MCLIVFWIRIYFRIDNLDREVFCNFGYDECCKVFDLLNRYYYPHWSISYFRNGVESMSFSDLEGMSHSAFCRILYFFPTVRFSVTAVIQITSSFFIMVFRLSSYLTSY